MRHPEIEIRSVDNPEQKDIDWADCLACFSVPENLSLKKLPWIHSFNAGVDSIVRRDDLNANVKLTRTTGQFGGKAGEFCLNHILNFHQNTFAVYDAMEKKHWAQRPPGFCKDERVLILGTGSMGLGIASTLKCLKMESIGVNTRGQVSGSEFSHCLKMDSISQIANEISCVINTLPLNQKTNGLIDFKFLSKFNNTLFINVGRGQSLVLDDLLLAIEKNHIAYAVLDVFEEEPLPASSPLWEHPKVFVSPHQAAITDIDDVLDSFIHVYESVGTENEKDKLVSLGKGY
ncbi:MAG: hypothetical protein HN764_16275 [Gammaproteobacteria bacterium]|nr:hypothetical protein [Gammaproteobacteria bacterium]